MQLLMIALMMVESSLNPKAMSPAGAVGLTQVTPIAALEVQRLRGEANYTPDLFNPRISQSYGQEYLEYCIGRTDSIEEALMCYNGGMRQVLRHREGLPLAIETENYYRKVLLYWDLLFFSNIYNITF